MRNPGFVLLATSILIASGIGAAPEAASPQSPQPVSASSSAGPNYRPVLNQYCVTCHNERAKTAGLMLDKMDLSNVPAAADVWERVIRKLRVGMMPPQGAPRPDQATEHALVSWLETTLDHEAVAKPNPGRPFVHRLNRAEYANAIRDVLALDVDAASILPPDESGYGFDNVAEVLGVSPVLLERYLQAAGKISAIAVGDPDIGPGSETFRIRQDASQDVHIEGLPVGTVGGLLARTTLALDGEYLLQAKLFRTNLSVMRGLEYPHQLEITVDGQRVLLASLGGEADFKKSLSNSTMTAEEVDSRFQVRLDLKAGPHAIGAAFLQRSAIQDTRRLKGFLRSSSDTLDPTGHPHIETLTIAGAFNPTGPGDTPSRRRIFICRPANRAEEEPCARKIVATMARRAYRGQMTGDDLQLLLGFYRQGRSKGSFDAGIEMALRRVLASPNFVFRVERDPVGIAPGAVFRLSDLELASRLSFFLWSTIPDDELLRVASQGRLNAPAVLDRQVHRMLADPKSEALVSQPQ